MYLAKMFNYLNNVAHFSMATNISPLHVSLLIKISMVYKLNLYMLQTKYALLDEDDISLVDQYAFEVSFHAIPSKLVSLPLNSIPLYH